jgi:DNA-binding NarL/FixJ family response regulator
VNPAGPDGMVGRAAELAVLNELMTGLADGRGGLAWVQGEPGVGKSTLIDAALARAPALPATVFRAAGETLMQPFPLRLMADCLGLSASDPDEAAAAIASLLRGEPGSSAALDPVLTATERMLELVDRRCAAGPVVLVAEDLQWADEPSLLVWSRLARAIDQIPLLLIGAARQLPQRVKLDQLRSVVAERSGVVLDLLPLDPGSAAALAGQIAGGEPGPRLRSALGRAGGNPLYVRELVDALVRDDLITVSVSSGDPAAASAVSGSTAAALGSVTTTSKAGPTGSAAGASTAAASTAAASTATASTATASTASASTATASTATAGSTAAASTAAPGATTARHPLTAELLGDVAATPVSLRVAIGSRLGFLSGPTLKGVRMAALLGHEFDVGELAIATGQRVSQLADVLADAIAGGILSGSDTGLRFRHELIQQVLVEQTPAALRRALHGEIARLLADAGCPVDSVARHLLAVPGKLDDWALGWLAGLPESALFALSQACAELLERAVESVGDQDQRAEALATRLAEVLFWLGRDEQVSQVAGLVVARTGDPVLAARLRILMIRAAGRMGRPRDAVTAALQSPGDDQLPPLWRGRLGSWSALLHRAAGDSAAGARLATAALEQASVSGDPLTIAHAHYACALCRGGETAMAHVSEALRVTPGTDPGSDELRLVLLGAQLGHVAYRSQPDAGDAAITEAVPLADRVGGYRAALMRATLLGYCHRYGRWDEALVHLAGIDPEFLDTVPLASQHGIAAMIALRRGELGRADAHLAAAAARLPGVTADPPTPVSPLTEALAMRAEAGGDLAGAVRIMSAWLDAPAGVNQFGRHDDLAYLVRVALAAGDATTARAAAEAAAADAAADDSPARVAGAAFCRAMLAQDAAGLLSIAADYRAYGWLPFHAAALEEAAASLGAAGDAAAARAALTGAVRVYADLGATWDIRRADARLRAHGIRRGPRAAHRRATTGWEALTPSEANIARMVARGLSNPDIASELFLSRRTVQTHVSNILTKLQARSRIDIVRTAAGRP